jgi:hypothetical protein
MEIKYKIPFWERKDKISSTFTVNGQHYVAYLNFLEKKTENSPIYEVVIKTYVPREDKTMWKSGG